MYTGVIVPTANGSNGQTADITGTGIVRAYGAFGESGMAALSATSGGSVTLSDGVSPVYVQNSGLIASFTITMSPNPVHGELKTIIFRGGVTALTVQPNTWQTILNAPTTAAAFSVMDFIWYDTPINAWLPR